MNPETRRLAFAVVLTPWLMVILVAAPMIVRGWQDSRSDSYIENPRFQAIEGCASRPVRGQTLARRCIDGRYRIRQAPERYRLPRVPGRSSRGWLRIGPDAAHLRDCFAKGCVVDRVVRNAFPSA